jgi:hypothetical protein
MPAIIKPVKPRGFLSNLPSTSSRLSYCPVDRKRRSRCSLDSNDTAFRVFSNRRPGVTRAGSRFNHVFGNCHFWPALHTYRAPSSPWPSHNNMRPRAAVPVSSVRPVFDQAPGVPVRGPSRLIKRSSIIVQLCRLINPPAIMLPLPAAHRLRPSRSVPSTAPITRVSCSGLSEPIRADLSLIPLLPSAAKEPREREGRQNLIRRYLS